MNIVKAREELLLGKTIYDMKLRVADYGRVSTDKDDQKNSLSNQIHYFQDMIKNVRLWTHVASFTDEGISGTQVMKREQFLNMIEEAKQGKIDLILTKEVSRFARNTIDSIQYTQMLLQYGVIVFFISDNINTIYPDSEFRLTLMASMAQDEVRKLSERVKFGIQRSIRDHKVGGGGLFGYYKKNCQLRINEEEAPIVKMIFSLYASGEYGFRKISEKLTEEGYFTRRGKSFSDTTLKKMITNPRYKGWYTANMSEVIDYKTHKKIKKPKEEWILYKDEEGNIPPIVSEEIWNQANKIHEEKKKKWNKNVLHKEFFLENKNYTSKIFCMEHHTTFIRSGSGKRKENPVWQCNRYLRYGIRGCKSPILYEHHLDKLLIKILEKIVKEKEEFLNEILWDYQKIMEERNESLDERKIQSRISAMKKYKETLLEMSFYNDISEEQFLKEDQKITRDLLNLKRKFVKKEERKKESEEEKFIPIQKEIEDFLDIRKHIGNYIHLFIDKILVSKIHQDRKHLRLQIIFSFDYPNLEFEIKM